MKRLIFIVLLLPFLSQAQDSTFSITETVKVDSAQKDRIYDLTLLWMAKTYNSSKGAIQANDKEAGIIASNGIYKGVYYIPKKNKVDSVEYLAEYEFRIRFQAKDGRYRIEFFDIDYIHDRRYDIRYRLTGAAQSPLQFLFASKAALQNHWRGMKWAIERDLRELAKDLEVYIRQNIQTTDW